MAGKSKFDQAIADLICKRIAEGESLRGILRKSPELPHMSTIMKWLADFKPFAEQYARARELQADALVEESLEIADDGTNDWMEKLDKDGENIGWQVNGEALQRSKLRVEQRRWWAGKLKPKVYSDKLNVEHSGSLDITTMSREDLLAELQAIAIRGVPVPQQLLEAPIDAEFEAVDEDDWSDLA
jgi:hypothetical protein